MIVPLPVLPSTLMWGGPGEKVGGGCPRGYLQDHGKGLDGWAEQRITDVPDMMARPYSRLIDDVGLEQERRMPVFDRDELHWESITPETDRGPIQMRRHLPVDADACVVMVGGVGGGFDTPGRDLYPRLAEDLAAQGIGALRIRFRDPRSLDEASHDVRAGIRLLGAARVERLALVGHSFGGAVVIRAAVGMEAVAAVVTLATQSYGTDQVDLHRPLLVIHGDADRVLPCRASVDVAREAGEHGELHVLEGSGHDLLEHRCELRVLLRDWLVMHLHGHPRH